MTTRIAIGNGKYCYTGPNCKIHGIRQVEAARSRMLLAINTAASAVTFSELETAMMKVRDANLLYDATDEGQALLKDLMVDADALDRAALQKRLDDSVRFAEEFEAQQKNATQSDEEELASFTLRDDHTYDVPAASSPSSEATVGSKYSGYQDVTEIAKKLRKDFKEAQEAGYLPAELKISVVGDKYSGGQALNISIQNVKDADIQNDADRYGYNAKGKELESRVRTVADAYNSRSRFSPLDEHSQSLYFSRVTIEDENSRTSRLKGVQAAKRQRAEKPARENFVNSYRNNKENALAQINFTHNDGSRSVGRVEGTSVYVFKNEIMGRIYVKAFDMSPVEVDDETPIEETILQTGQSNPVLNRRNILKPVRRRR